MVFTSFIFRSAASGIARRGCPLPTLQAYIPRLRKLQTPLTFKPRYFSATHNSQVKVLLVLYKVCRNKPQLIISFKNTIRVLKNIKLIREVNMPKDVPELLGTIENELGIRKWLEDQGHTLVGCSSDISSYQF